MAEKKEKQYVSDNAQLMAEWDWEKNDKLNISPYAVSYGSHQQAWWKCSRGHSWNSIVSNRTRLGRRCPYCAGQKPILGENDLCTTAPTIAKEWNYKRNENIYPEQFMEGSHKKVWWICEKGHEWFAQIKSRANGVGCPYCANKRVLKGYNDLETTHPELALDWHPTKNELLKPDEITYGSGKKVWWVCKNGHEWEASVCNRTKGQGCPICSSRRRTSFPEQAIFYYVKKAFPDAISGYKDIFDKGSMELDIYIPQLKIGIEYDGKLYHYKDRNRLNDAKKYSICRNHGISLIRITDNMQYENMINCTHKISIPKADNFYLNYAISKLLFKLGKPTHVDVASNRLEILKYLTAFDDSLQRKFPELANEWNFEKNGFSPNNIHPGSNEKVWWICSKCGHEWMTSPAERSGRDKTGCPVCAIKIGAEKRKLSTLSKRGSVAEIAPYLLDEWDFEKNEISPELVSSTSSKTVGWKCSKGHKWETPVYKRVQNHSSCPICTNKVLAKGVNDLATVFPNISSEWNYEKNAPLLPTDVTRGSAKTVWWKCVCGHEWKATVHYRTNKQQICPECAKARG